MKRYEQIPHTADLAARIYGGSIPDLFENAACAMFGMMTDTGNLGADMSVKVELAACDTESLLISWLNELLYLSFAKKAVFRDFKVRILEGSRLIGEARGQAMEKSGVKIHVEIKAATYHDIVIKKTAAGYETVVVFDI
ncbi:MAG: archease [Candidatus Omnitrophota bacterium]